MTTMALYCSSTKTTSQSRMQMTLYRAIRSISAPNVPAIRIRVVSEDGRATNTYTIADLGIRYDANEDGVIDRDEAVNAIVDYFDANITRDEVIGVIRLYFSS